MKEMKLEELKSTTSLAKLREVVVDQYNSLSRALDHENSDPAIPQDKLTPLKIFFKGLGELFKTPLICFSDGYERFIGELGTNGQAYDRWINIQISMITDLGLDNRALEHLPLVFNLVFGDTEGGEQGKFEEGGYESTSFLLALAFRIYCDVLPETKAK